ncbi:hypothetical protein [Krasilnikovia sp. MM14-A1259]|uniref:hypothetical protein n=1 Tax=Krasilnikovia sp. MM14-A1259 TaxID=3373539 RepID=UPI003801C89E
MTERRVLDPRRLAEAAAEATVVLGVVTLPAAWRMLDTSVVAALAAVLVLLTAGTYALHAVTFDCFRLTGHRDRRQFSYTQRKD